MEEMERKLEDWRPLSFDIVKIFMCMLDKPRTKKDQDENSMLPSEYMRQMSLTTEDRMAYLIKPGVNQNLRSTLGIPENTSFKAVPTVIVFQTFVPGNVYNATLTIRNSSQVSRCLKSCCQLDPFFDIEFRGSSYTTMVAPGLAHVYNVKFSPVEKQDYKYQATFATDDDVISVPIIAIGSRAILDIPDRIEVPGTAVKVSSSKTILIRNVGDAPANFTFFTDSSHFRIDPSNGLIEAEESIPFTVRFQSQKAGEFEGNLFLKYETGEILRTELRSSAINCTIRTDRGSVKMEDTYLGMSRSKILTIHNRSDYIVKYKWMCYKDSEEDDARREDYKKLFDLVHEMEVVRSVSLEYFNICMPNIHELVCQRIYGDEITSLMNETFEYNHLCFLLTPMKGEIWPHSSTDVTILFRALEVGEICSTAYLEISGREDRIPLSLCGIGKGPVLRLNVITIDVDKIYMYSVHYYEIVAANKGYIPGTLIHKPKPTDFGGLIKIEPSSLTIEPGEYKSYNLCFSSSRKGNFLERIDFIVKESLEIISLHVKGCVICPTLHFDKKSLDFGVTPLGFSSRQEVSLHNLSSVPVTYSITVLNDGTETPLTYEDYARADTKLSFSSNPREFVVQPEDGIVRARSFLKIRITYTANIARSERSFLRVDMWNSESDPVMLPISFCGSVASLSIQPPEISIRFCFINFPYTRTFNIDNDSDLDGYFYIVPQSVSDNSSSICYSLSVYQGFIKARQSRTISMTLITRSLGKQSCTISMLTMGEESPIVACTLSCTGQGPVISLQPTQMDFGEVKVLVEKTMKLQVVNDAPIPAQFQVSLNRKNSPWSVNPTSGELEPNESMDLNVEVYLRDSGKYEDNILMAVHNSRTISVNLKANGVGCSVVFTPNVFPTFDMGLLFSHQKASIPITAKNHGSRPYQLIWSNTPELRVQKGQIVSVTPMFQVQPVVSDLPPSVQVTVHCKICWERNESISEEWYLFGQMPGQSKRELVGTSTFKATFTEPHIVFSKKELTMRIDMSPCGDKYHETDDVSVTNKSGLDLNVRLAIRHPFYMITELGDLLEKTKILLADRATAKVRVKFTPSAEADNLYSKSYRAALSFEYDEHPMKDKIKCKGSVNYPNLKFSTHHINMACEVGCSEEYVLTLTNEGSIPVIYKFVWLEESIKITKSKSDSNEEHARISKALQETEGLKLMSWQSENRLTNQQIGAGDAPSESLIPPMNSPASEGAETQRVRANSDVENIPSRPSESEESDLQEVKELLMSIVDMPTSEDTDIDVLEVIGYEPRLIEPVNEILDIVPHEGIVLPYTSQNVHFGFHGFERVRIEVVAACEIVRGPIETVQILAIADAVRYSVDKRVIDLGQQLFCESCNGFFNLRNECTRAFTYIISTHTLENDATVELSDSNRLTIKPLEGTVDPESFTEITLNYRPMYLGPFNVEFQLKIAHLVPLVMSITGVGIYPQVFLDLPQIIHPNKCPAELGYQALRSLSTEFMTERDGECVMDNEQDSIDNEWIIVSADETTVPSTIDVNMALERILASQFIEKNLYVLTKHNAARKKSGIPQLFSLEYVIDLGNVVIGLTAHYSAMLTNYGPTIAEVKMKKMENKIALINSDIVVQFKKNVRLPVGSNVLLHVICTPTLAKYTERNTELNQTVYLEVTHGCTIPVIITGMVTYPYIIADKKQLDFGKVLIGECSMMYLTLTNEGLVDCDWKLEISKRRKKQDYCPFSIHQESDSYPPGRSGIVEVYFKPREPCCINTKLNVVVNMGLEFQIITLTGYGVERKLNINEPVVKFSPTVPYLEMQELEFTIENTCEYPVEFFWHHLDDQFMHEDRVAKILTHYYGVEEILLPPRKLGEGIPEVLLAFYNDLVSEIMKEQKCDEMSDVEEEEENDQKTLNKENDKEALVLKRKSQRRSSIRSKLKLRKESSLKKKRLLGSVSSQDSTKDRTSMSVISDLDLRTESTILNDPVEMEKLLLAHIDELKKNPNFNETMKDPVKNLFDQLELESTLIEKTDELLKPKKKVCIIFHGAPYTAYQEIACISARALGIPVLSIDTAILETAAFGKSECSDKLRQTINETYQDYTTRFSEYRDEILDGKTDTTRTPRSRSPGKKSSPRSPRTDRTPKSGRRSGDLGGEERFLPPLDDTPLETPLESYNKLSLTDETLISMDMLSQYQHKVRAIQLLEKILPARVLAESVKDKASVRGSEKSGKKKQESTFLDLEPDILFEALAERLSREDFERGFVLQTLENMFILDKLKTLPILLGVVGCVEFLLFVTLYNSADICNQKIEELKRLKAEKIAEDTARKIQEIDEMSYSEYEELPEEDKNVYLAAILPLRRQEAAMRKVRFSVQLKELKKKKEERRRRSTDQKSKGKKGTAGSKSKLSVSVNRDEPDAKTISSRKDTARRKGRGSPKPKKESIPREMIEITTRMDEYHSNLKAIVDIIKNWDPFRKNAETQNKGPKALKSKEKIMETPREGMPFENNFHIWYVRTQDPWSGTMNDLVVSQIKQNNLINDVLHKRIATPKPSEPKIYSILAHRGFELPSVFHKNDTFELVSIAPLHEEPTTTELLSYHATDSAKEPTATIRQSQADIQNKRKRSKTKATASSNNVNEATNSLRVSTTGNSEQRLNSTNVDLYREEDLKARLTLRPNEKKSFKIRYRPLEVGDYEEAYVLSIVDHPCTSYRVQVDGVAAVPRLDMNPNVIFPKITDKKIDETNEPSFFLDTGNFDFGSLVLLKKEKRTHRRTVEFTLQNITPLEAEVSFRLTEHNPDGFNVEPETLVIPPHESRSLTVSAGAVKLGSYHNKLFFLVKNNPRVDTIELRCIGIKLDVELEEKQLSFGRVLLYRKEDRVSTIRNRSTVPIFWRIEWKEFPEAQITFAPSEGLLQPLKEQLIEFSYDATTIGVVQNSMNFEVFLHQDDEEPVQSDVVTISGETYDVSVDIDFANPIDLKAVKVGHAARACIAIKNRGNYEVKYVIKYNDEAKLTDNVAKPPNVKKNLEINPAAGSVQSHKTTTVQMIFVPKQEMRLKKAPILKCHILDANQLTTIVAEFPLTVSLLAYYNTFRLKPYPVINFGTVALCTKTTMYLDIENTGSFPFHYTIQVPQPSIFHAINTKRDELRPIKKKETARSADKRDKRSGKTDKTDANTENMLDVGPFAITKMAGDIDAGEIDTIAIECYPEIVGSQDEQINVVVPDSVIEYETGQKVTLSVNSCIPSIDFENLDRIFRNNHIVDNVEDFLCPKEIGAHTVYARQPRCLYFRHVIVSSAHTTCFELHNEGVVAANAEVKAFVKSPVNRKSTTFSVEPQRERIPAQGYKRINISFAPAFIETYYGQLEISLNLPAHLNEEKLIVNLIGEACVPEIMITEPTRGVLNGSAVRFRRTLVEETSIEKFAFENIGLVQANVIVEVYDDPNAIFGFAACPDTRGLLHTTDYDDNVRRNQCAVVRTMPKDVAQFEVKFCPREVGKYTACIRLFVVDNPYDNLTIDLEGESFLEVIVLQDLDLVNFKSTNHRESSVKKLKLTSRQSLATDPSPPVFLSYKLDYGTCYINKMYKRTFKIVNKSADRCFRFQWTAHPNVVFVPSIGHLQQSTSKQVTATLLESEPKKHEATKLECVVSQIEISNHSGETSWDDRQTIVRWEKIDVGDTNMEDSISKKSVEPSIEPEHTIIPGTTRCILLLMNANVGFSEYSCSTLDINFKDTLMFQKREYTFTLSNPAEVNTDYVWVINMDEEFPKRISESTVRLSDKSRESRSRLASRSSRGVLYPTEESSHENLQLHRCKPLPSHEAFSDIKPRPCSCKGSDLYSSTACLTDRSTDSWLEGEDLPFQILPESGTLLPGESVECTLKFSPGDVFDYKAYLTCKIENLNPNLPELVIPIKARSVLPYCHFDVPESDYISSGKRNPKLPGPIGYTMVDKILENMRVIELNVVGVGGVHTKRFRMINPTADDYHFSWKDCTLRPLDEIPNFQSQVSEGIAERGKQTEMVFTFMSTDVGTFESFWLFSIEQYNLKCMFLLVAIVKEPVVHCTIPHLKLKPTILGHEVRDTTSVINKENFDISFQISPESLYSEGRYQNITVTPMNGVIKANGEQTLSVNYKPTLVGEFQFSARCTLKFLRNPLVFFVTTTTYNIVPTVTYTNTKGELVKLLDHQDNIIDLGKIIPKRSTTIRFEITNSGNLTFYYSWDLGMSPEIISMNAYVISMPQKQGHVASESSSTCSLAVIAKRRMFIRNHCVILKISRGPTYRLILKAIVSKAPVEFSFRRYDFGGCYVRELNSSPYLAELRVSNSENKPLLLECKFEERPHISVNLDELAQPLPGKSTVSIPIAFRPLQETSYEETLTFLINSTIEENIKILGEGITYKIHLVNPRDKVIDLGSVGISKIVMKKVPVINEGRAPVDVKFDLISNLFQDKQDTPRDSSCSLGLVGELAKYHEQVSVMETKRSNTDDENLQTDRESISRVLSIEPSELTRVRSKERVDLTIRFKPTCRMKTFTEKMGAKIDSTILSLAILRGGCIGPEFHLNRTYIAFGTIVRGCTTETELVLMNTGDVGAKFSWDTSSLPLDFQISPKSGYSSPGMNVHFLVKFEPTRERNIIEGHVSISRVVSYRSNFILSVGLVLQAVNKIEKFGSLELKVSGACSKLPDPIDTLSFMTNVRSKQLKSVTVVNDTVVPWKVKPEIAGEYFYTNDVLNIPPEGSTSCTVTYQPLVMNTEDTLHKGTLLIRLPDDRVPLLYALQGLSLPPQSLATIVRRFPAKMKYTELLPVYNWMNRQQRFRCIIETVDAKKSTMPASELNNVSTFSFTGNNNIDIPGNNQRDYRAVFHSYKEANLKFKITFINDDGEYQFYDIHYTITKPEVIEIIKLITTVRTSVCRTLQLQNPLKATPVTFTADCHHPRITISDIPIVVSPLSSGHITISYYPLLTSEETCLTLDVRCQELGHFPYELRLTALPPLAEKTTHVTATLGSFTKFVLPIKNVASKKTDFIVEADNDSFTYPSKITVDGSTNGSINVIYEPHDIENTTATLVANSNTAGVFTFPIVGSYSLPKPQGPYTLTSNTPTTIKFKNVFKETKTFEFITNNSVDFETDTTSQEIESKQEFDIVVNLREVNDVEEESYEKYPITGKLSVHCTDPRLAHVVWIYYLRGIIEET
ncbi:hypothetical protein KPH14_005450 [Odynerus spinipes]|uniref:HYDIN/VesB/CFA65-like Ig-like domain-containing protein n=1 Tax=Odynerus spinipes TaxID=1348599 RepID=A0AAD9RD49_9HYME|nr:hypothetical protein KPH14_005450 [Odynerus spinipes]